MGNTLNNKSILITGAGSGLGRATALVCSREGASLMLSDIDSDGVEETKKLVVQAGGTASVRVTDVSNRKMVESLVTETVSTLGGIHGAFNNAGVEGDLTGLARWSEKAFDQTLAVNVKGVWLCMKYQIPAMLQSGGGSIVNTSSAAGLVGVRGGAGYVASKHAVVGLTKVAAVEWSKRGIRVNAVCPGMIDTPMLDRLLDYVKAPKEAVLGQQPIGRFGDAAEIGESVAWLLSEDSSFVTGVAMPVDGGFVAQ